MLKIFDGSNWVPTDQEQSDTVYHSASPPEDTTWMWNDVSEDAES